MARLKRIKRRKSKEREKHSDRQVVDLHKDISAPVIRFWQWLKRNGFLNETHLDIYRSTTFGYGIFSHKKKFQSGDCLMSIPRRLLITSTMLRSYKPKVYGHFEDDTLCLIVFLMNELDDVESPWVDYFEILPTDYRTLPCRLPPWEIKRHLSTVPESLKENYLKESEKMTATYWKLHQVINNNRNDLLWTKADLHNWDLFEWAYCTVNTRVVYLPSSPNNTQTQVDKLALVPFFDLLNHSPSADVYLELSPTKELMLYTRKPIDRFSQVFIKYNNYSNRQLLLHYGYTAIEKPDLDDVLKSKPDVDVDVSWIKPSEQDVVPLTYQSFHDWLQNKEICLLKKHISIFFTKRLSVLCEIDFIKPTDTFELTWPSQAFFCNSADSLVKFKHSLTLLKSADISEEETLSLDYRLDIILQLMVCPKWDSAANIRRLIHSDQVYDILPKENIPVWEQYYQLWIDLIEWTLVKDYKGITLDGSASFDKYLMTIGRSEVKALIGNEIAMLCVLRQTFQQNLVKLSSKTVNQENNCVIQLENLSL